MQKFSDQVLAVLDRAVSESTTPTGPIAVRRQAIGNANAEIYELERQLGIAHGMPILNAAKARKRLAELTQLAAKGAAPTTSAAPESTARVFQSSGDPLTDKAIKAAGCHSLRQYSAKLKRDRFFAAAVNLPPGSTARACAEANLTKAQTEFNESL